MTEDGGLSRRAGRRRRGTLPLLLAAAASRLPRLAPAAQAASPQKRDRRPARRAAVQPPALGRGPGGREGHAALRPQRRPDVHPGEQHQARGERRRRRAVRARLDRAHQRLRQRPRRERRAPGRPGALRPRRPDLRRALLRRRHHRRRRLRHRPHAEAQRARRASSRAPASPSVSGDLVGDGSWFEPTLVHPALGELRPQLVVRRAGVRAGLQRQQHRLQVLAPATPSGRRRHSTFTPDFGDVTLENRTRTVAAGQDETIDFFRTAGTLRVWAQGNVEAGRSEPRTEYFALPDPEPLHRAGAARRARGRRASPCSAAHALHHRLDGVRDRRAAARRSPRSPAARSRTGSSRSSTPARTGTPR